MTKNGLIFKDPIILFRRLWGQKEMGRVDEIALGYFEMFTHQYRLADLLYTVMNEQELEAAGVVSNIMMRWKSIMGSVPHFDWSKTSVGFETEIAGSREKAETLLEGLLPDKLIEFTSDDILSTSVPGGGFAHLWMDDD